MEIHDKIISAIKSLGNNLIYVEIGVYKATTLIKIYNECPNIKKIYGIDFYKEHKMDKYYYVNKNLNLYNKKIVENKIKAINKIELIVMESIEASKQFQDNSIDVIFLDIYDDFEKHKLYWIPKLKNKDMLFHKNFKYN
jgi:predicted O-methyltransferase YrrM